MILRCHAVIWRWAGQMQSWLFLFFFNVKWSIYTRGWVKLTGSPSPLCPPSRCVPGSCTCLLPLGKAKQSSHPNPARCSCPVQAQNRSWRNFWKEICHLTKCCLIISHLVVFHKEWGGFPFRYLTSLCSTNLSASVTGRKGLSQLYWRL